MQVFTRMLCDYVGAASSRLSISPCSCIWSMQGKGGLSLSIIDGEERKSMLCTDGKLIRQDECAPVFLKGSSPFGLIRDR